MNGKGQRPTAEGTAAASVRAAPRSPVVSERAAVIPLHPFTGLLRRAVEKGWRLRELFQGFEFDHEGKPLPGQHVNFLQAREIILRARHQGGDEVAAQSGARK